MRLANVARVCAIAVPTALLGVAASCVLADPAPTLPPTPLQAPHILHDQVQPPHDLVLATWPTPFLVPIEVSDPSTVVFWNAFIDWNPIPSPGGIPKQGLVKSSHSDPADDDGGFRVIAASLSRPTDLSTCHVVEIVIASASNFEADGHTPAPPGGDTVSWFYNPTGDPTGCPTYDAGPLVDGSFPDAGVEGGD